MTHTPEALAARLHDPQEFTVGELTLIAGLFEVDGPSLLAALVEDERSDV